MTRQKFNVLRHNKLLFIVLSSTVFPAYGLDSAQIAQVTIVAQVAMDVEQDQSTIPGVVAAIADDTTVIWQGGSNCDTQYETSGIPCPASTVATSDQYRVGSESKTYAGTVILRMIDDGDLSLSDTLQSLLPALNIPNASSITIQDLLQMTSGIPDYLNAPALFGESGTINDQYVRANGALEITPPSVYIMATNSQSRTSGMSYSNTNFAILGLIAEATSCNISTFTSCQTLEQLLTHYVMTPVSMTATLLPDDDQFTQAHATGYVMVEAGQPITGTASLESDDANELSDAFTFLNPKLPWAAGAIVSTPADQILWNRQLTKNNLGLLSASLQNQRLTNTVPGSVAGIPANYGLAIYNMRSDYNGSTFIGHSGAIFGFTSSLFYNTDSDLFYVVDANQFPAWQTARDFLWQVDKGVHFVEDQQGNCQGSPSPMPTACQGLSVRTASLTVPSGDSLSIENSQIVYTGYNTSQCQTNSATGEMTCSEQNNTAPTLIFYGHDLEGVQINSGTLTVESGAILQCTGRNCSAVAATGSSVIHIYGSIIAKGAGSEVIKGNEGNDTVHLYSGASVTGDIDLGSGMNEIYFTSPVTFDGNIILSSPQIKLSNGRNSLLISLYTIKGVYQVQVTDSRAYTRIYTQDPTLTTTTLDGQTISSNTVLIPIDLDGNGKDDMVLYQNNVLNKMALKISPALLTTNFLHHSHNGGASGVNALLLMLLVFLSRTSLIWSSFSALINLHGKINTYIKRVLL